MRLIRLFNISYTKAFSLTALTALAIAVAIGLLSDSNNARAQDIGGEHNTLSHISPVVWDARGSGDYLSPAIRLNAGVVVVDIGYTNASSSTFGDFFLVKFIKTDGSDTHSVLHEHIAQGGTYSGARAFNVGSRFAALPPGSYHIEIQSEGSWHIDVSQPSRDVGLELPRYIQGSGDDGAFPYAFNTGVVPIYYEFNGPVQSSFGDFFRVQLYKMDGSERESVLYENFTQSDLPKSGIISVTVNDGYSGDISPSVYMLAVEATGAWRIALGARSFDRATPMPTSTRIPATPTPTATPAASNDVINRLIADMADLKEQVSDLATRVAVIESGSGIGVATATPTPTAIPTPTPTATPVIVPGATPSPTPTSVAGTSGDDACITPLAGSAAVRGSWTPDCLSANSPNNRAYYARFYTFTLSAASEATITLSSPDAAPYLFLREGEGKSGAVIQENGSADATSVTTTETLQPGSYTIETSTWEAETAGDFTLELEIR